MTDCFDGNRHKSTLFSIVIYWYWFFSALFFLVSNIFILLHMITGNFKQGNMKRSELRAKKGECKKSQVHECEQEQRRTNESRAKREWVKLSKQRAKTRAMKAARSGMYWNLKWSWWNQSRLSKRLCWKDPISKSYNKNVLWPFFLSLRAFLWCLKIIIKLFLIHRTGMLTSTIAACFHSWEIYR